ncbi:MAG: hypothetical protein WAW17_16480 [Rhodococcus sp. (in: high G+C Gram-positive bacteria)]|uniref:hypothetical protein n=1 Tax=Rhodococcus sp. TaxID=1831 RepID=UPI003BAE1682
MTASGMHILSGMHIERHDEFDFIMCDFGGTDIPGRRAEHFGVVPYCPVITFKVVCT